MAEMFLVTEFYFPCGRLIYFWDAGENKTSALKKEESYEREAYVEAWLDN